MTNEVNEDIRYGYQAAIAMATYEGTLSWTAISAYTPLLLAFIAGSVVDKLPFVQNPLLLILVNVISSALGVAASYLWYSATLRSRYYHKYWIASARDLEAKLTDVTTLQRGASLKTLSNVCIANENLSFPYLARHSHTRTLSALYIISLGIFFVFLIFHLYRLARALP